MVLLGGGKVRSRSVSRVTLCVQPPRRFFARDVSPPRITLGLSSSLHQHARAHRRVCRSQVRVKEAMKPKLAVPKPVNLPSMKKVRRHSHDAV